MSGVGVGVIGAGPWGMNLSRVFSRAPGARLAWICDRDADRLARAGAAHPGTRLTPDVDQVLGDAGVEAVAVAVDSPQHHAVARRVLAAGRHVLVEKPLATSLAGAAELVALARERQRVLMVGHVLLFHPAIVRTRELITDGTLGDVLYIEATRVAFGTVRPDESVWWSVGPHDVSVALYLLDDVPVTVSATGAAYLQAGRLDVAFASLRFADGRVAHVHVSWLAPGRRRALTVVGTRRMLTFNEGAAERPLLLHERARGGAVEALPVPELEPLVAECDHFLECVARGQAPRGGAQAMGVMRVLDAGERSMRAGGAPVEVA